MNLYIVIAPTHEKYTGDFDYAQFLFDQLKSSLSNMDIVEIFLVTSRDEIDDMHKRSKENTIGVVHIIYPTLKGKRIGTGCLLLEKDILSLKKQKAIYICDPIEVLRFDHSNKEDRYKNALEYHRLCYENAEHIVVHTQLEVKTLVGYYRIKKEKISIIQIPSTVPMPKIHDEDKFTTYNNGVICFGMIKKLKGIEEVLGFARYLRNQECYERKVIVAGNTATTATTPEFLAWILGEYYESSEYILGLIGGIRLEETDAKKQLCLLHDANKDKIKTNLEIYFDITPEQANDIFSRCSYSFYFYHNQGLSIRLSSFKNCIARGLYTFSFDGHSTVDLSEHDLSLCWYKLGNRDTCIGAAQYEEMYSRILAIEQNPEEQQLIREKMKSASHLADSESSEIRNLLATLFSVPNALEPDSVVKMDGQNKHLS
ncbi:MAG: hypothetical protein OEY79_00205 [Anaplasmataceae bacterium]|nr:hypothetical protein [Anaplasmataceae bacterium]